MEISGKNLTQSCEMSLCSLKAQRSSEVTQQNLNDQDNKDAQGDVALPPDFSPAVNQIFTVSSGDFNTEIQHTSS